MRYGFSKIMMMLAIAGLMSACGNQTNKAPDKLVREGTQLLMADNSQYNFSGAYTIDFDYASTDNSEKNVSTSSAASVIQASASSEIDVSEASEAPTLAHNPNTRLPENIAALISKSISIPFTGATDLSKGRVEFIPEYKYDNKNALISIKFPMQIDVKNLAVYLDSSAITNISDALTRSGQNTSAELVNNRYLQFSVPQNVLSHLPISDLLKDLPKAVDDGYTAVSPTAFTKVDIDEFGKSIEAKSQVQYSSTGEDEIKYTNVILESLSKSLKKRADDAADGKGKYKSQDYIVLQKGVDELRSFYTRARSNNFYGENDKAVEAYIAQIKKMPVVYNYYFDKKGRIIAFRTKFQVPVNEDLGNDKKLKSINIAAEMKLDYTNKPKFTMEPTPENTLNMNSKLGLGR